MTKKLCLVQVTVISGKTVLRFSDLRSATAVVSYLLFWDDVFKTLDLIDKGLDFVLD
jgi:hypothetical protein